MSFALAALIGWLAGDPGTALSNLAGVLSLPAVCTLAAAITRHLNCPVKGCWRFIRHGHTHCPIHQGET